PKPQNSYLLLHDLFLIDLNYKQLSIKPSQDLYIYNQLQGKMTKGAFLFSVIMFLAVLGCTNEPNSAVDVALDNLYDSPMIIHSRTMPLMGQVESLRSRLQDERHVVINSDTNRFRKVNRLLSELNKAEDAMFTWMNGFNPDTITNMEEKLNYIKSEL